MVGYRFAWEPVQSHEVGKRISILAFSSDEGLVSVGGRQLIRCTTMFPPGKLIALHNWILSGASLEQIFLTCDTDSLDVVLPDPSPSDFFYCSEVCAGLGGTSFGAQLSGLKPVAAMDKSPLAVEFLKRNRFPAVIHGDLASKHQVGLFHLAHDTRVGLLAGFPCQPFSSLGRHLAFLDDRAKTFFHILDLAFLIQCAFLLLECVVAAGRHKVVRESLASFCRIRGFKLVEQILHLHRALPNHRRTHLGLQPSAAMYETRVLTVALDGGPFSFTLTQPSRVCDLLDAEAQLHGNEDQLDVWENGVLLAPMMLISGSEVTIASRVGYGPVPACGISDGLVGLSGSVGLTDAVIHHAGLSLLSCAGLTEASFLSPFTIDSLILQWPQTATQAVRDGTCSTWTFYGLMLVDSHWTCFQFEFLADSLCVTWCDGFLWTPPDDLRQLVTLFSTAWSISSVHWTCMRCFSQLSLVDCGTVALMHLGKLLGLWCEFSLDLQRTWHLALVAFQHRVGFGPSNEAEAAITWLENFLPSKGVPTTKA